MTTPARLRFLAACGALCLLAAACADASTHPASDDRATARAQSLLGATDSTDDQNTTFYVYAQGSCTGALVAPNLVLTAKHCLLETKSVINIDCTPGHQDKTEARQRISLDLLHVFRGKAKPLQDLGRPKQIFSAPGFDVCKNDTALILLENEVKDLEPLKLRLVDVDADPVHNKPAIVGDAVRTVGWGVDESGGAPLTRKQRQGSVVAVGGGVYQPPGNYPTQNLEPGQFFTNTGFCFNDDGAPMMDLQTNAIVGLTVSNLQFDPGAPRPFFDADAAAGPQAVVQYCMNSTVLATAIRPEPWLMDAFAAAGYAPWREGHARPNDIGGACSEDLDCNSRFCFHGGGTNVCSRRCDVGTCPEGFECVGATGNRQCAPHVVAAPPGDGVRSGCTTSATSPHGARAILVGCGALAMVASVLRRRRRLRK